MSELNKSHTEFYINTEEHPESVPLYTLRNIKGGARKELLPYTVYKDGRVKSENSDKFMTLGKDKNHKPSYQIRYVKEPGDKRNKKETIPGEELVITSFFKDKEAPMQVLQINRNEMDISLGNLIPLWTLTNIQQYWISRFAEEKGLVRVADFGVINQDVQEYLVTEAGEMFSLLSKQWMTCPENGGYKIFHLNTKKTDKRKALNVNVPVHRLICYTFHGPPPSSDHTQVDHINQNKEDNSFMNLRWVSHSVNQINRTLGSRRSAPIANYEQEWRVLGEYKTFNKETYSFDNYEVSDMGLLRKKNGELSLDHIDRYGYVKNNLTCSKTGESCSVYRHRLVASVFLKQTSLTDNAVVDHINEVRSDNRVRNLRYLTQQQNIEHSVGQTIQLFLNDIVVDETETIKDFVQKYKSEFGDLQYKITNLTNFTVTSRNDNKQYSIKRMSEKKKLNVGEILLS